MSKYTPGPWRVEWRLDRMDSGNWVYAGSRAVADVNQTGNEGLHNVRLISAAPDLLDALKRNLRYDECASEGDAVGCSCPYHAALDAIAKAEGRVECDHPLKGNGITISGKCPACEKT